METRLTLVFSAVIAFASLSVRSEDRLVRYRVEGATIPAALAAAGDAARGKQIVLNRDFNCILCHAVPASGIRAMGNVGPALHGVGGRLSEGELRLRIVDAQRVNRDTIMPSYYRVEGLNRVAIRYRGKPLLDAQQVEDVVAYLSSLR